MEVDRGEIESAALNMDPESRAQLAARLIQSLDAKQVQGIDEKAIEQLWLDEAERRLARIDAGTCAGGKRPAATAVQLAGVRRRIGHARIERCGLNWSVRSAELRRSLPDRRFREIRRIEKLHGKGRWRKLKGLADVRLPDGAVVRAEIHWYEAHGVGRRELKIKRLME